MFGSLRVGQIGGIDIELHITFLLIVLWAAWQGTIFFGGLRGAAYGILLILLLFSCVLLHELGHGFQARTLGIGVERITLLPIGGLAKLESIHNSPRDELLITLAGPAVNLGLALILGGITVVLGHPGIVAFRVATLAQAGLPVIDSVLLFLLGVNASLFFFNMLPAFPMDGGRVVRALLALVIDYVPATRIAATIGRVIAGLLTIIGMFGLRRLGLGPNPLLVLLAIMVYVGATQETIQVRQRDALSRVAVEEVANGLNHALSPSDPITPALAQGLFAQHAILPVVVDARLIGLLTPKELRRTTGLPSPTYVAHIMRTDFPVLTLGETLWTALEVLRTYKLEAVPVVHNGNLQGMLTLEDINRFWRGPRL